MSTHGTTSSGDPYKKANAEDSSIKTKIEGLTAFVDEHKMGMLTTRQANSGMLVSRCMAVATRVSVNVLSEST
jgi:hypothetical protein